MKYVRTTLTLPDTVLDHIKERIDDSDTLAAFFERAAINQLEREFMDYTVREKVEEEHGRKNAEKG